MNPSSLSQSRYTTKAYDASKRIPDATFAELLELLRNAPSSVNSQPWHFVVGASPEARQRVATAGMADGFAFNETKVRDASHVIVLCTRTSLPDEHLASVLAQEQRAGRFDSEQAKAGTQASRLKFVNIHRQERDDLQHWMEKQTYLALGTLLLGAAALGVDATPIEGFDAVKLDQALGLREKGFTSTVVVSLGYRAESDFNASLPKSRLTQEQLVTWL
jgi:nitroreductase/dihydropteridine reductase